MVITSPTYEGIIADIREIARIVHEKDRILIVDEAHGAHLGLVQDMPDNAVRQGADLVIHSLHKTLPSMTRYPMPENNILFPELHSDSRCGYTGTSPFAA